MDRGRRALVHGRDHSSRTWSIWTSGPAAASCRCWPRFGMFQMALPYVLFARGLRSITSQEATGIGLLEPLLLPLWVYLAWGEVPAPWTWSAALDSRRAWCCAYVHAR